MNTSSTTMDFGMTVSGDAMKAGLALLVQPPWSEKVPLDLKVDGHPRRIGKDWPAVAATAGQELAVTFSQEPHEYTFAEVGRVANVAAMFARNVDAVVRLLEAVPFEVASFMSIHPEWRTRSPRYRAPGFSDGHGQLGWGCAFKGRGHDRLASRRWLDHGPWRLVRGAGDLSVVQFHDLQADSETALEQARPGHQRMGITDEGGFIQSGYVYTHDIDGFYDAAPQQLKIVVHDRDVTPLEILDAAAALKRQALGSEKPLRRLAFVFLEPDRARTHLEELWLHGLECWTILDGNETRLDADYTAPHRVPDWVRAVEGG